MSRNVTALGFLIGPALALDISPLFFLKFKKGRKSDLFLKTEDIGLRFAPPQMK
jgi:hypothetical protein